MSEPMRRTQARIAERERHCKEHARQGTMRKTIPLVLIALVVLAGLSYFFYARTVAPPRPANAGIVGPKLQVDQNLIDFGEQHFNTTVRATFDVKNVGDSPLSLNVPKVATVKEGC